MYPGMMYWWRSHRGGASCHDDAGCAAGEWGMHGRHGSRRRRQEHESSPGESDIGAGAFGVRRPLRFLAYKLELDDQQVAQLARILDELKTERAQAEVDGRRATAALADAISGEHFDQQRAGEGGALRVSSAEHLRDAVLKALGRIHALLEPEQRERLAYLVRTGTLQI